jgi:hypothetical protein
LKFFLVQISKKIQIGKIKLFEEISNNKKKKINFFKYFIIYNQLKNSNPKKILKIKKKKNDFKFFEKKKNSKKILKIGNLNFESFLQEIIKNGSARYEKKKIYQDFFNINFVDIFCYLFQYRTINFKFLYNKNYYFLDSKVLKRIKDDKEKEDSKKEEDEDDIPIGLYYKPNDKLQKYEYNIYGLDLIKNKTETLSTYGKYNFYTEQKSEDKIIKIDLTKKFFFKFLSLLRNKILFGNVLKSWIEFLFNLSENSHESHNVKIYFDLGF